MVALKIEAFPLNDPSAGFWRWWKSVYLRNPIFPQNRISGVGEIWELQIACGEIFSDALDSYCCFSFCVKTDTIPSRYSILVMGFNSKC
ncbi:MAG: hypothetical protein DRR19_17100 [Candidatus Parabeggiatoa sp. nov. 1]|nr:MAG: hypothetical protein DRR19_17100 [Gammaproteobacteria bacterium]